MDCEILGFDLAERYEVADSLAPAQKAQSVRTARTSILECIIR